MLVLLQSCDVQGRRGPSAPLLQLPVLEDEVEGGQGHTGLRWGLAERVRHAAVQVGGLHAVLPTRGEGHTSEHQGEGMICGIGTWIKVELPRHSRVPPCLHP